MESVIKWQTGQPKVKGDYLVTLVRNVIDYDEWTGTEWDRHIKYSVIAWCSLNEIEPYKE